MDSELLMNRQSSVWLNKCVAKWHTDGCTGCKECRAAPLKWGVSSTFRVCGCLEREHKRNEPVSATCHWGLPREIPYLQRVTCFCPFHSSPPSIFTSIFKAGKETSALCHLIPPTHLADGVRGGEKMRETTQMRCRGWLRRRVQHF